MIPACIQLLFLACLNDPRIQTVARWDFDSEDSTNLGAVGNVQRDQPGPRPPEYPGFDSTNTAIRLDGKGAHLVLEKPAKGGPFDFGKGDSITLEAWVQLSHLGRGANPYVIGKGRTGEPGFEKDNQNWALRLREQKGLACVNFLFASKKTGLGSPDSHWHRFTTREGFKPGKAWHHVAIAYEFGKPASVRAWLDGKPCTGTWDMGGPTVEAPVVDRDAVWIGSSQGGLSSSSFTGSLDAVVLHRGMADNRYMAGRYRREGVETSDLPAPEKMPDVGNIPAGKVLLTVHENAPANDRWLLMGEEFSVPVVSLPLNWALLDRLPLRYDAWGIRDEWNAPLLVRMAADLPLPAGKHSVLARVRGLSRLWVDGKVIGRSGPLKGSPSGEEPITPVAKAPHPRARVAEHRQQEVVATLQLESPSTCRVVLETIVGGKQFRADPGETLLAFLDEKAGQYRLLGNQGPLLEDRPVNEALALQEVEMSKTDDIRRRALGESRKAYWSSRHQIARQMVLARRAHALGNKTENYSVDWFISEKLEAAVAGKSLSGGRERDWMRDNVLPVLQSECFRCHGEKSKGGLRLDNRQAALQKGESGKAAVVPGHPETSELIRRVKAVAREDRMPPAHPLDHGKVRILEEWVRIGAPWATSGEHAPVPGPVPSIGDHAFARRVFLDTIGIPPTEKELVEFANDKHPEKRSRLIDKLLADERHADHWMGYWQDVLAENPTLLNGSLNTTGPFRWFLHDAFRDRKGVDQWVSELIALRGGRHEGGSAGFGLAAENDTPLAAKAQIICSAFLGMEMQCAKCHDAPFHDVRQKDLFSIAAFFDGKPLPVPPSSRVPASFFEANQSRQPLIKATLKGDDPVPPGWPLAGVTGSKEDGGLFALLENPANSREKLAALVTSPANRRFPQVMVNRVWRNLMGAGIVEPPGDWEGRQPSHPELLQWLADELSANGYDLCHVEKLILNSQTYQREASGANLSASHSTRYFRSPDRRRLYAEQIVDSLHAIAGVSPQVEELCFDPDGRRLASNRLSLGKPRRAWMLASLANERDRPSLTLPKARLLTDVLEAFGWSGSRQFPRTDRETGLNVLQPGTMANSLLSVHLSRAVPGGQLAQLAMDAESPAALTDTLFLRILGRLPSQKEKGLVSGILREGFETRVRSNQVEPRMTEDKLLPTVTWSNHLRPESTQIGLQLEQRAKMGQPPDARFSSEWRERYEDLIWSLFNLPEFVWVP